MGTIYSEKFGTQLIEFIVGKQNILYFVAEHQRKKYLR